MKELIEDIIAYAGFALMVVFFSVLVWHFMFNGPYEINGGHCYNGYEYNHATGKCRS